MNLSKIALVAMLVACLVSAGGCEPDSDKPEPQNNVKSPEAVVPAKVPANNLVKVKMETTKGDIVIELNKTAAPITVENFLKYTADGHYDGTIFHRVISGFMIQGGGFDEKRVQKETRGPIRNEASNGLKNSRGTIAMARTPDPDSATNQFFINHKDNANLNYAGPGNPGYAVFGKVVEGMEIVDAIAAVKTGSAQVTARQMGSLSKTTFRDVPVENVVIKKISVVLE